MTFEEKCWGRVCHLFDNEISVSILKFEAGFRCSIHLHERRWNSFRVITGVLDVVLYHVGEGGRPVEYMRQRLGAGDTFDVPPNSLHRFDGIGSGRAVEVYWTDDGSPVNHDDIVRLDVGGKL